MINILMVDECERNTATIRSYLAADSAFIHHFDSAHSVQDALPYIEARKYHILIVGNNDPSDSAQKTGVENVRMLRINGVKMPAILLTETDANAPPKDECRKLNISRCCAKTNKTSSALMSIILDTLLHYQNALV
jgi:CheY-like chemotaxis protein